MNSSSKYLISGQTSVGTGNIFSCIGTDSFSASLHATSIGTNPATGTLNIDARLDGSAPWVTIFSNAFAGNSGVITQFNGPFEALRATLIPLTTGTFTVVCRYA